MTDHAPSFGPCLWGQDMLGTIPQYRAKQEKVIIYLTYSELHFADLLQTQLIIVQH